MPLNDTYRTFIAVHIQPEKKLSELFDELRNKLADEQIRWVDANNLHLTLRFLGDTTIEQIEKVKQILKEIAEDFSSFEFELKGLGYFQNHGRPRVLFVNIENDSAMKHLSAKIEERIPEAGFECESRPFKAHLTLGRIKNIRNKPAFYSVVKKVETGLIQKVKVSEFIYYESILKPAGPVYKPIEILKLEKL